MCACAWERMRERFFPVCLGLRRVVGTCICKHECGRKCDLKRLRDLAVLIMTCKHTCNSALLIVADLAELRCLSQWIDTTSEVTVRGDVFARTSGTAIMSAMMSCISEVPRMLISSCFLSLFVATKNAGLWAPPLSHSASGLKKLSPKPAGSHARERVPGQLKSSDCSVCVGARELQRVDSERKSSALREACTGEKPQEARA